MSEAYIECLRALPEARDGYSDTLSDNPVLRGIKKLQAEVKRLTDENALLIESADSLMNTRIELEKEVQRLKNKCDARREQLDTIRNAVQPQENGPYYIDVEGAVAEILWNDTPQDKGSDV